MKNVDPIIPVSDEGLYPIRTVSEVSGVNSITLRAWERRYGLFKPKRTPKGHRLYSDKDIQRVHQVLELLAKGVSIGRVAKALKEGQPQTNFSNVLSKDSAPKNAKDLTNTEWLNHQETLISKINTFDTLQLEIFHHALLTKYDIDTVSSNLIRPVLLKLSQRAEQLQSLSGDFHFYKIFLLKRIGGLFLKLSIQNSGKKLLIMGLDNEQCEVELLLFSMSLLNHGYQIVNLGCDISFDAIPMTLNASDADAILLFSDDKSTNRVTTSELKTLVNSFSTPVFITGQFSEHQEKSLTESGLFVLPKSNKKQMTIIDETLNKNTK